MGCAEGISADLSGLLRPDVSLGDFCSPERGRGEEPDKGRGEFEEQERGRGEEPDKGRGEEQDKGRCWLEPERGRGEELLEPDRLFAEGTVGVLKGFRELPAGGVSLMVEERRERERAWGGTRQGAWRGTRQGAWRI